VRLARPEDREFALAICTRLGEGFPLPGWRTPDLVAGAERDGVNAAFDSGRDGELLLIAEDGPSDRLGFAHVTTQIDYFVRTPNAHVSILAVREGAEGRGVGRALLEAAEAWARDRGFDVITLNVFAANARARALYERTGYGPDTIRYLKPLA
jgi:GNAT superfamily N-acetyltransferase